MIEDLWTGLLRFAGQFVVPDWGALVALIPVGLAGLVFLYVTWVAFRFATAGPTSRGTRRLAPVPPPGVHLPGPTFAPILAAFGTFMLLFGLFSHGVWTFVGVAALVITLLYWGREAVRDYDRLEPGATAAAASLPVPARRGPPPGVHVPHGSFRPLLVAIAMTILVAGLIVGGWALAFGFVAVIVTSVGWLRDARREYAAVERADRTGHLDLGSAPAWPQATFAALAMLIAGALLLSSGILPNAGGGAAASGAPGGSGATGGGGPAASGGAGGTAGSGAPATSASLPAADATLTAKDVTYSAAAITVPAGKQFTLLLDNEDSVPHNVQIKDAAGASLFKGDIFTGPAVKVYTVPALTAGQYTFVCSVHPNMTGTVTAR